MSDDEIRQVPIKDLVSEDGAHELATSENMQPYLRLLTAGLQNKDTTPQLEEIARLPLEKRYIWRIASALKWGFADFDSVYVPVDRETLSAGDLAKVVDLLRFRPLQLCIFLKALLGEQTMLVDLLMQASQTCVVVGQRCILRDGRTNCKD
jgi:hypothetical protein